VKILKILIVDDDDVDRAYYKRSLAQYLNIPCEIIETDNAREAIKLCEKKDIDCVLVDYILPDLSGLELVKQLKKNNEFLPIIMLTGQGDESIAVAAMKEGVSDYIVKSQQNPLNLVKTIMNATEKSRLQLQIQEQMEQLRHYAYYDELTGFLNRHAFEEVATREIAEAKRRPHDFLAILYMDLDNFKNVNDTLGHPAGDELLKEAAKRLNTILRSEDIRARLGGDEFAVLLTHLKSTEDANKIACKIIEEICLPYQLSINIVHVGASIGIACYPDAGDNLTELLKNADIALYRAKESGRGTLQFYSEEMKQTHQKRLFIEQGLHNAILKQEFFLEYQPKFILETQTIIGMEALLRWNHPQLGVIFPDQFIPIAEESGLIIPIGQWVLETACRQFQLWNQLSSGRLSLTIAINLSPRQLTNANFVETMSQILKSSGVPAECIELEITESTLMRYAQNELILQGLHALSLQITIDDFGRGYSSLSRLKQLPISSLKIDYYFVKDISEEKMDGSIVKSIVNIGKDLGLYVVAEGIETEAQLNFLLKCGCPAGQGNYFSKPLGAEKMTALLLHYLSMKVD
jgi:diguanylate cyclase (GGDEF)-like protein